MARPLSSRQSLKWTTPRCPRNGVLIRRQIVYESLAVDEPNLQLRAHVTSNSLDGRAHDERVSFQDRITYGWKVRAPTRSCGAPNQQIVCGFDHRIIQCPPLALPSNHSTRRSGVFECDRPRCIPCLSCGVVEAPRSLKYPLCQKRP